MNATERRHALIGGIRAYALLKVGACLASLMCIAAAVLGAASAPADDLYRGYMIGLAVLFTACGHYMLFDSTRLRLRSCLGVVLCALNVYWHFAWQQKIYRDQEDAKTAVELQQIKKQYTDMLDSEVRRLKAEINDIKVLDPKSTEQLVRRSSRFMKSEDNPQAAKFFGQQIDLVTQTVAKQERLMDCKRRLITFEATPDVTQHSGMEYVRLQYKRLRANIDQPGPCARAVGEIDSPSEVNSVGKGIEGSGPSDHPGTGRESVGVLTAERLQAAFRLLLALLLEVTAVTLWRDCARKKPADEQSPRQQPLVTTATDDSPKVKSRRKSSADIVNLCSATKAMIAKEGMKLTVRNVQVGLGVSTAKAAEICRTLKNEKSRLV